MSQSLPLHPWFLCLLNAPVRKGLLPTPWQSTLMACSVTSSQLDGSRTSWHWGRGPLLGAFQVNFPRNNTSIDMLQNGGWGAHRAGTMAGPRECRQNLLKVLGLASLKMFVFSTKSNGTSERGSEGWQWLSATLWNPLMAYKILTGGAGEMCRKLATVSVAEEVSK